MTDAITSRIWICNPLVSIVMGVYNGERFLRAALESVLAQDEVDFEVVVIDDGSTDMTGEILEDVTGRDRRVRFVRQDNRGLTRSLERGCSLARGKYIARQDADDLSLPGRLRRQIELMEADAHCALASCWVRTIGPEDEVLFEREWPRDGERATRELIEHEVGPAHGSVLFRRDDYQRVGGYRPAFRYAQDWDLWLRLVELGGIAYVPEFLYAFRVTENSISSHRRDQQMRLGQIARQCYRARQRGQSETQYLEEAAAISEEPIPANGRGGARSAYFIGKCLLDRRDPRAAKYLRRSVRRNPFALRPWGALLAASTLPMSRTRNGDSSADQP